MKDKERQCPWCMYPLRLGDKYCPNCMLVLKKEIAEEGR